MPMMTALTSVPVGSYALSSSEAPIMGLDLSLTSSGITVLDGNGGVIFRDTRGYSVQKKGREWADRAFLNRGKIERLLGIAASVLGVAREFQVRKVYIEDYAYSKHSSSVTGLAELHGVVKCGLLERFKIYAEPVSSRTIRATCLGAGCGGYSKEQVRGLLAKYGMVFDNDDLMDSYMVAMYGFVISDRGE